MDYEACHPAKIVRYRDPAEMAAAYPASAVHYESHGVVVLEDCGIGFDREFIGGLSFAPSWKKIGTINGLTDPPLVMRSGKLVRTANPLCASIGDDVLLLKLYSELLRLELEFKLLVARVLPGYWDATWGNCTFRFTRTENEAIHLDSFQDGKPTPPKFHRPRLKLFLNVDAEPRVWNVGPTLPDLLRLSEGELGAELPTNVNVLCARINASGILSKVRTVRVEIPPRGIVFANGATVVHQVVYGNRMVCLEGLAPKSALQPSSICEWDAARSWIEEAGYAAAPDEAPAATSGHGVAAA